MWFATVYCLNIINCKKVKEPFATHAHTHPTFPCLMDIKTRLIAHIYRYILAIRNEKRKKAKGNSNNHTPRMYDANDEGCFVTSK